MRYVKVFTKHATMYRLIIFDAKVWVDVSQGRRRVKAFAYKASSLHLWEHGFPVVLRVWMSSVTKQRADIGVFSFLRSGLVMLRSKADWRQCRERPLESRLESI